MPYMQRITWSGVALHAGVIPGYPASHGCIRLPHHFAAELWGMTKMGARVIVAPEDTAAVEIDQPAPAFADLDAGPRRDAGADQAKPELVSMALGGPRQRRRRCCPGCRVRACSIRSSGHRAAKIQTAADGARQRQGRQGRRRAVGRQGGASQQGDRRPAQRRAGRRPQRAASWMRPSKALDAVKTPEAAERAKAAVAAAEAALADCRPRPSEEARAHGGRRRRPKRWPRPARPGTPRTPAGSPAAEAKAAERGTDPISIFISKKTGRLYIRQAWAPIHEAAVTIKEPEALIGTHTYLAVEPAADSKSLRWLSVTFPAAKPVAATMTMMTMTTARGRGAARPPSPSKPRRPGRTRRPRVRSTASTCPTRRASSSPSGCGPAPRSSSRTRVSATRPAPTPTSSCCPADPMHVPRHGSRPGSRVVAAFAATIPKACAITPRPCSLITTTHDLAQICTPPRQARFRVRRHGVHSRADVLAAAVPDPGRRSRRRGHRRSAQRPASTCKPFYDLMANEAVVKVFHAARQDLEIVWTQAKLIPHPIFDTQVAAMVCGFGEAVSYVNLVKQVTGRDLDKSSRFTDWSRRPLSQKQLTYALADVTYLRDIYKRLKEELEFDRPRAMARRGDGHAHRSAHLRKPSRGRLAAPQAARQEPQGAGRADRAGRLARARRPGPGRAAQPRAARRGALRHRRACPDRDRHSFPSCAR